jgi:diguanylate cyclase (GGDEF)-like protein
MTIACCVLNGTWVIKDVFVKGIGAEGSLFATVLCRLTPLVLVIPFIILSIKYKRIEAFLANGMMYINIICQILSIHFSGTPTGGTGNMIMNLAIFMLHYASASGISQVVAQILYPISMFLCSQNYFGFFYVTNNPVSLLFSNMIMSIACILAATILRITYYNNWLNKCKLVIMSKTDSMSGVWNRKRINDITDNEKLRQNSTIIMLDIDNFKSLNDNNGHDFGDHAIYDTVKFLRKSFPDGTVIRYGGDEFLIVVNQEIKLAAVKIRITNNIVRDDITYSIGVAYGEKNDDIYGIIKHADIALYKAKETKNKVIGFQDDILA